MVRSGSAVAHALGKPREIRVIAAVHQLVSEARASQGILRRNRPVATKPIVRRGHAKERSLEPRAVSPRGPQCQAITATAQALQTVGVRMSSRRGRNVIRRPIITTAAILSSHVLTTRRPRVRTQSREPIPRRAVATRHRHAPTPRRHRHAPTPLQAALAEAVVPEVVVAGALLAAVEAEAHMAAVAEARTAAEEALAADPKLFANSMARPDLPGGFFIAVSTSGRVS